LSLAPNKVSFCRCCLIRSTFIDVAKKVDFCKCCLMRSTLCRFFLRMFAIDKILIKKFIELNELVKTLKKNCEKLKGKECRSTFYRWYILTKINARLVAFHVQGIKPSSNFFQFVCSITQHLQYYVLSNSFWRKLVLIWLSYALHNTRFDIFTVLTWLCFCAISLYVASKLLLLL